jgi:hypothetical protein
MKNQRSAFALENEPQIKPASAFHKGHDPPQAHPGVKVRVSIGGGDRLHGGENLRPPILRNAAEEAWRSREFHPAKSSTLPISLRVPARRVRAVSSRIRFPAWIISAGVRSYSRAK